MPKGRTHVPAADSDGNWYEHRGLPHVFYNTPARVPGTTTGTMLATPYSEEAYRYPFPPPRPYLERDTSYSAPPSPLRPPPSPAESVKSFKSSNSFSIHNNRNTLQDCGEYFGDGRDTRSLGKNIINPRYRQHFTGPEYLSHIGQDVRPYTYNSIYRSCYQGDRCQEPPSLRRYPKKHLEGNDGPQKLDTSTTDWYRHPDVPYKTHLQVLASSQEPHLKPNSWKYSYHGLPRIYPPYDISNSNKDPAVRIF